MKKRLNICILCHSINDYKVIQDDAVLITNDIYDTSIRIAILVLFSIDLINSTIRILYYKRTMSILTRPTVVFAIVFACFAVLIPRIFLPLFRTKTSGPGNNFDDRKLLLLLLNGNALNQSLPLCRFSTTISSNVSSRKWRSNSTYSRLFNLVF